MLHINEFANQSSNEVQVTKLGCGLFFFFAYVGMMDSLISFDFVVHCVSLNKC